MRHREERIGITRGMGGIEDVTDPTERVLIGWRLCR
jgi:hypothetical protein